MEESGEEKFVPKMRPAESPRGAPKGISRREVLESVPKAAVGVGLLWLLGKLFQDRREGSPDEQKSEHTAQQASTKNNQELTEGKIEETEIRSAAKLVFDEVFSGISGKEWGIVRSTVDEMKYEVIAKNSSYRDMVWVTQKNEQKIRQAARENDIPEEIALGIVLIENGGGDDLTSGAGARGPCQLMKKTAERYHLIVELPEDHPEKTVEELIDERINPEKCFKAMTNYLADMREGFGGNLGIAVWGYHAGEGNVYSALREYFKDTQGIDLGDIGSALDDPVSYQKITSDYNQKIKETNLNVHQLLSNQAVRDNVLAFLEDETNLYVYKAVGGAELFGEEQAREDSNPH